MRCQRMIRVRLSDDSIVAAPSVHAAPASPLAEPTGDLVGEGQAVVADEQAHGRGQRGQRLLAGEVQLVRPELDLEQRAGGGAQALTKRRR